MRNLPGVSRFGRIVGQSEAIRNVFQLISKAAGLSVPVLITGETGTGKELVAREIHERSERAEGPFVALNTGALTRELMVSELFGHVKGAFTGALGDKTGRFGEANDGTLFLDEIATMDERVQVTLLRVLEAGAYRAVGAKRDSRTNARLVAATNVALEDEVEKGTFRADLFHRLQVISINVPPLRDRREDIPMLVSAFIKSLSAEYHLDEVTVGREALDMLIAYRWPGNVRELRNAVAQAAIIAEGAEITPDHLPARVREGGHGAHGVASANCGEDDGEMVQFDTDGVFIPVGASWDEVQRAYALRVLDHCGNNKTRAAEMLQVSRKTLYDKMRRWGVFGATA